MITFSTVPQPLSARIDGAAIDMTGSLRPGHDNALLNGGIFHQLSHPDRHALRMTAERDAESNTSISLHEQARVGTREHLVLALHGRMHTNEFHVSHISNDQHISTPDADTVTKALNYLGAASRYMAGAEEINPVSQIKSMFSPPQSSASRSPAQNASRPQ